MSDERVELIIQLAEYIQRHRIVPTVREYQATRGTLPDESTLRTRLGSWTALWREALGVLLLPGRTLESRAMNARIMALAARGVHAEQIAGYLNLRADHVHMRLRDLRRAGFDAYSTATNSGVGQPKARTRWRLALASEWPLTREVVMDWYDEKAQSRGSAMLAHWVRVGWIQQRPDGAYDRIGGPSQ